MRMRTIAFGLYADKESLAWVRGRVDAVVDSRSARIVREEVERVLPGTDLTTAEVYDFLAEQWAAEHPGRSSGTREPVKLRIHLACSLRTRRDIRKEIIGALCPEGREPHACRVPWIAL